MKLFSAGEKLFLPQLEIKPILTDIGRIRHVLINSQELEIKDVSMIKVSPRRSEQLLTLCDGQKIVATEKKKCTIPPRASGVLFYREENGKVFVD